MRFWTGVGLLVAWPAAFAAGIDCERARTAVERTVCSDTVLRSQDAALARSWARALAVTAYPEELKADQRAWLKRLSAESRDADENIRWLRFYYALRLAELDNAAVAGRFEWRGHWRRADPPGWSGEILIRPDGPKRVYVDIEALARGMNGGFASGPAEIEGDVAIVDASDASRPECRIELRRVHRQLSVGPLGDCGEGSGVHLDGRYVPAEGAAPDWNLLTLGVVREPEQDRAIRQAMGAQAYADLIRRSGQRYPMAAHMGTGFMEIRGSDEPLAWLQQDRNTFWLGVLAADRAEVACYTNDAEALSRPPAEFVKNGCCDGYPLRAMSAPGRPLMTAADGR